MFKRGPFGGGPRCTQRDTIALSIVCTTTYLLGRLNLDDPDKVRLSILSPPAKRAPSEHADWYQSARSTRGQTGPQSLLRVHLAPPPEGPLLNMPIETNRQVRSGAKRGRKWTISTLTPRAKRRPFEHADWYQSACLKGALLAGDPYVLRRPPMGSNRVDSHRREPCFKRYILMESL